MMSVECTVGAVEDFVVEYREVKSKTQTDCAATLVTLMGHMLE
jgi:hypothetical protein